MRRALIAVGILCVAGSAHASEFWDEVRTPGLRAWRQDMARAEQALAAERLDQAVAAAESAIRRLPDRAEGYVVRGLARGKLGQIDPAIEDLDHALQLEDEALDDAWQGQGAAEMYARAGRYETASQVLGRVLGRMRAGNLRRSLYGFYGDVLMTMGPEHLQPAIRAYREALRANRYDPGASLGLALALHRASERIESRDLARTVGSRGRVDQLLSNMLVPDSEKAARRAIAHAAIDDQAGARAAWQAAQSGPWREHAVGAMREASTSQPQGRRRGSPQP